MAAMRCSLAALALLLAAATAAAQPAVEDRERRLQGLAGVERAHVLTDLTGHAGALTWEQVAACSWPMTVLPVRLTTRYDERCSR